MPGESELKVLQERVTHNEKMIEEVRGDIKEIKGDLMYRLPLWATALLSILCSAVAWLLPK